MSTFNILETLILKQKNMSEYAVPKNDTYTPELRNSKIKYYFFLYKIHFLLYNLTFLNIVFLCRIKN